MITLEREVWMTTDCQGTGFFFVFVWVVGGGGTVQTVKGQATWAEMFLGVGPK